VLQACQINQLWNIKGIPETGFIELQLFAKGVAVFCDSVQNCRIRQDSSPAFADIKAQKGRYMKSALADFISGVRHDY
jgi:hypothetical protein